MKSLEGAPVRLSLLIFIVALSQLSETIYTAALPDIARDLQVADRWVEATLTTFLAGFACGVLFWGRASDQIGRKPALLAGLALYGVACWGCYTADCIGFLLGWRFVQAVGASTGSVIGQAIAREAFGPAQRGAVYSTAAGRLGLAAAAGACQPGAADGLGLRLQRGGSLRVDGGCHVRGAAGGGHRRLRGLGDGGAGAHAAQLLERGAHRLRPHGRHGGRPAGVQLLSGGGKRYLRHGPVAQWQRVAFTAGGAAYVALHGGDDLAPFRGFCISFLKHPGLCFITRLPILFTS